MIIASWNVNSVRARLAHLQQWLAQQPVDVLLLQELKTESASFPAATLQELGFTHQKIMGEKSYNGVALLSRHPISDEVHGLPNHADNTQARFVGGCVQDVWIYNLYAPNGNPLGTEKYTNKLAWLKSLQAFAAQEWARGMPVVFSGDFNIIPTAHDVKSPENWVNDALYQPAVRQIYAAINHSGWADAYRLFHPQAEGYTFFDYRAGAWPKRDGIRIDHFLLSPEAVDKAQNCWIDTTPRGWENPSDHVPILLSLA